MNSGLGASSGSRNINISTSGTVKFRDCLIGQNSVSAIGAYYIDASGSGTLAFIDCSLIGTAPTGVSTGSQSVTFNGAGGAAIASAATITLPSSGEVFSISGTTTITSVTATNCDGRRVTLVFQGALTFTDGSNLLLAGNFVTTADDTITLVCSGANWYETSRSVN
jgi:hypothetical protein